MEHAHETGPSIYRRRRRRRAVITMTLVTSLLIATVVYAATYVQGWVGTKASRSLTNTTCQTASTRPVKPGDVTINVYNTTLREGLAASVARSLQRQGFKVAAVGNDPLGLSIRGVGEIRHGLTGTAAASLTGTWLSGAGAVQDDRTDGTVDIVLGKKFIAVHPPAKGSRSITATPVPCPAR